MASLATDVTWGSSPTNYFNFSYSKQRSGTTQQYKITIECEPLTGSHYFGFPIYLEITVNGKVAATKTLKSASPSQWSSALTYTTAWLDVANKTTGTTPLKIRVYSGSGSSRNTTYSYSLDIDPAASLVKATDANIESVSSVIFTRYNSAFTHTLAYKAAGQSSYTTIFEKKNVTSYAWTIPKALYKLIPNDTEIEVTLRCQTYSGSTLMGTDTCTMTATAAKSKCAPSVSITAEDSNANSYALTGNKKKIIKYHSDIAVTATATEKNEAKISKVTLKCGSSTATGTSKTFTDAESVSVSATATDSRGYSTTANATGLTLINYVKLTANTTVKRTTSTGDEVVVTTKGNYYNGSFGAQTNTLKAQVRYKPQSQEAYADSDKYADMTITISGNTYTAKATLTGFDYQQAYDIRVRVQDKIYVYEGPLADAKYNNIKLSKGIPIFDWGENDIQFNVSARFRSTGDAVENSNGKVAVRIGPDDGQHIDIDTNEIMAKADAENLANLSLAGTQVAHYINKEKAFASTPEYNRSYFPLMLKDGGYAISSQGEGVKILTGNTVITPSAADTPTAKKIEFPSGYFSATPTIILTVCSSVPERCSVGYQTDGTAGMDIYLTRTNTSETRISYLCIGS